MKEVKYSNIELPAPLADILIELIDEKIESLELAQSMFVHNDNLTQAQYCEIYTENLREAKSFINLADVENNDYFLRKWESMT